MLTGYGRCDEATALAAPALTAAVTGHADYRSGLVAITAARAAAEDAGNEPAPVAFLAGARTVTEGTACVCRVRCHYISGDTCEYLRLPARRIADGRGMVNAEAVNIESVQQAG
jgi:hypothetical protein